jgi:hypothetical protein
MKKTFNKIRKYAIEIAADIDKKDYQGVTEEDLDILAEAIEILNDMYETLYDEVFVEIEEEE